MPSNKYLKVKIDNEELDIDTNSNFPITFDYQLEDTQDFQRKKSSESIGMKVPATLNNQKLLNTLHNTSIEDNTVNSVFKNIRNITAEANGVEIFVGKALPKKATKRGGVPISYELNCFGNNADWLIDLKEVTIYELIKHIQFIYNKPNIENSWSFDGTDEALPYVFAPVKYGGWMDPDLLTDSNYSIKSMKPSLSVYWILFWGFKSAGYKIQSTFFDTAYFRKLVMPWTYGAFLTSEGTKYEIHKFLAKSPQDYLFGNGAVYADLSVLDTPVPPCYDNNNTVAGGDYNYIAPNQEMQWAYNTPHYGPLEVTFSLKLYYDYLIDLNSSITLRVHWFKNSILIQDDLIVTDTAPLLGSSSGIDTANVFFTSIVNPTDTISCKVWIDIFESKLATVARCYLRVDQFHIEYFKIPIGGTIFFDSYLTFQKNKFLDFFGRCVSG